MAPRLKSKGAGATPDQKASIIGPGGSTNISWILTKYLLTAAVVVVVSEVAKRSDKLGAPLTMVGDGRFPGADSNVLRLARLGSTPLWSEPAVAAITRLRSRGAVAYRL